MKKVYDKVKSYFGHAGFYFMLTVLVFAFVALGAKSATLNLPFVWTSLLFSLLMGLCDFVFLAKFLKSYYIQLFLHAVLATVSFALAFALSSDAVERNKTAFFGVLIFGLLMVVIDTVRAVIHAVHSKKSNAAKEYTYLYSDGNGEKEK